MSSSPRNEMSLTEELILSRWGTSRWF